MSSALFSTSWYRVAKLKPKLRSQAQVYRHLYRGERWYVIQDLASGRFMRINPAAYRVVALMDGIRTLENIWQNACLTLGDEAPTQDEILQLLSQLHQSNVLLSDRKPDLEELNQRSGRVKKMKLKQYISNPLSLKVPLYDPDKLLNLMVGWVPSWGKKLLLLGWLALMVWGGLLVAYYWEALTEDMISRVFTPENVLLLWFIFPIVKLIHEFGHGLMIKLLGGQCHEMGVMFLALMPIPYLDASYAMSLRHKGQRMLIGMGGMMLELAVAVVAIALWREASPGLTKAILYQTIMLAGMTTLIFNINPLLRFDGYYILADWLEIPSLGKKANQYWGYLTSYYLFGVRRGLEPLPLSKGEAPWLICFGLASFGYRMVIAGAIIFTVAAQFFFVGVLLACWAGYSMLVLPIVKGLQHLFFSPTLRGHRGRAVGLVGLLVGGVLLVLGMLPVGSSTLTEGVIWMPEQSRVVAPMPCFGERVVATPGAQVQAGELLLVCDDVQIRSRQTQLLARQTELENRLELAHTDPSKVTSQIVRLEWEQVVKELHDNSQRLQQLKMYAAHAGRFAMPSPQDFVGRYITRGDLLGYVLDPARYSLVTVVPQGAVDLVSNRTVGVALRSVDQVQRLIPARIIRQVPAASQDLPSMALSLQGGGEIGLDPGAGGQAGGQAQAIVSLFQFELAFEQSIRPQTLGSRLYVRFEHTPEPLLMQWYRSLRQTFLKRFAV
ncbi:peptidase, M50 family [Magnetococcus marinus MC-1]|uniref:Peptidase, M50 family n=1 Tax=Magnetococcus marinus (strain ATCC BAA-1437 / JCM 17883 / MC-1) TaxID=156889 RepID=A0L9N4_MAGMM|nr:PqqD family peptide modification chaperone [Magnetococcus marinus]ABK44677.1 peptidase, M50 family [Magnetococcus marinus MC-1]